MQITQITENWLVSGLLEVKLDPSHACTTGRITRYQVSNFATSSISRSASDRDTNIKINAGRRVNIEAEMELGVGRTKVDVRTYFQHRFGFCRGPPLDF